MAAKLSAMFRALKQQNPKKFRWTAGCKADAAWIPEHSIVSSFARPILD
jgi:hypothetical protein